MSSHLSKLASLSEAKSVASEAAYGLRAASAQGRRMAALRTALAAHTIKRALAAVGSASDEDYRTFGLHRGELLAQLRRLHGAMGGRQTNRRSLLAVTISLPVHRTHRPDDL